MKTLPFLLATCFALALNCSVTRAADLPYTKDSLALVKSNLAEEKAILIDVRDQDEWDEGHVKGAVFLPLSQLRKGAATETLRQLPKDKILYTYCKVGARAWTAGNLLQKQGYQIRVLKSGYEELVEAGFPNE